MQGFPSLQRFSPLKLPTFPPPQCHLPTFSGDGEGWQISLSDYNFQVPSVAHHLGSEAFQPAEPSGGCRLPHHRSDLHPDRITAAPAGENILACNQVPLLSAGLTVLCCKRLGKSIKSSPKSLGKWPCLVSPMQILLQQPHSTSAKRAWGDLGMGGSQWGVGFQVKLGILTPPYLLYPDSNHLFHTGPRGGGILCLLEHWTPHFKSFACSNHLAWWKQLGLFLGNFMGGNAQGWYRRHSQHHNDLAHWEFQQSSSPILSTLSKPWLHVLSSPFSIEPSPSLIQSWMFLYQAWGEMVDGWGGGVDGQALQALQVPRQCQPWPWGLHGSPGKWSPPHECFVLCPFCEQAKSYMYKHEAAQGAVIKGPQTHRNGKRCLCLGSQGKLDCKTVSQEDGISVRY